ncbi:hypothetical protein GGF42_004055, partial [Coemansia sp. RSA 2424]
MMRLAGTLVAVPKKLAGTLVAVPKKLAGTLVVVPKRLAGALQPRVLPTGSLAELLAGMG